MTTSRWVALCVLSFGFGQLVGAAGMILLLAYDMARKRLVIAPRTPPEDRSVQEKPPVGGTSVRRSPE